MSMQAPFVDAALSIDPDNFAQHVPLVLHLGRASGWGSTSTLRGRSDGQVTLDDYMRAVWGEFGKPGQAGAPGVVTRPYTVDGLRATLGKVAGDPAFADDFFAKYVQGHELADYRSLLGRAGLVVRPRAANRPWLGNVRLRRAPTAGCIWRRSCHSTRRSPGPAPRRTTSCCRSTAASCRRRRCWKRRSPGCGPGGSATLQFVRRTGERVSAQLPFEADPRVEIVPAEDAGGTLTPAQKQFRDRWLAPRAR